LADLEDQLLAADMGIPTVEAVLTVVRKTGSGNFLRAVREYLITQLPANTKLDLTRDGPSVLLVVGVNGTGKTTTAAKLAHYYHRREKQVLLVGADTYRAAALEQLRIWARRVGVRLVCNEQSRESAAVLFDGLKAAQAQGAEVVIVDTAGRLHTYKNLMLELNKMYRVVRDRFPAFHLHSLITIDANLGQNSLIQAKEFARHLHLDGAVLTKMDGTAKGGIVFPLYEQLQIPVYFLGVGEGLDDLYPFNAVDYVDSLLGNADENTGE
jgi:fused signal recognition particle receptor